MEIQIFTRGTFYGEKRFYPANTETARVFSTLSKQRTLDEEQLGTLRRIGAKVVEVPDPQFTLQWA